MPKTCEPAAVDEYPRPFFGCSEIIRPSAVSGFRWERPYRTRFARSRDVAARNEDKIYFLRLYGGCGFSPLGMGILAVCKPRGGTRVLRYALLSLASA